VYGLISFLPTINQDKASWFCAAFWHYTKVSLKFGFDKDKIVNLPGKYTLGDFYKKLTISELI
jgi:hypothetical protein